MCSDTHEYKHRHTYPLAESASVLLESMGLIDPGVKSSTEQAFQRKVWVGMSSVGRAAA